MFWSPNQPFIYCIIYLPNLLADPLILGLRTLLRLLSLSRIKFSDLLRFRINVIWIILGVRCIVRPLY